MLLRISESLSTKLSEQFPPMDITTMSSQRKYCCLTSAAQQFQAELDLLLWSLHLPTSTLAMKMILPLLLVLLCCRVCLGMVLILEKMYGQI